MTATVVERIEGHYDVQEVAFGRIYRWCPERIVAECGCGERTVLTDAQVAVCSCCGERLSVEDAGEDADDEILRPWRYEPHREEAGLPC